MNERKDEFQENSPAKRLCKIFAQEVTIEERAINHGQPHVEEEQAKISRMTKANKKRIS